MKRVFICYLAVLLLRGDLSAAEKVEQNDEREAAAPTMQLLRKVMEGGPYGKPWKMDGIGKAHFPVTSSHPEVQQWFDQGVTLTHSFWWFEARRSFRWCLKLDPEFAMGYWALAALLHLDSEPRDDLLREAVKRKDKVSARERLYIEAWAFRNQPLPADAGEIGRIRKDNGFRERLEEIVLKHPEDVEAKSLYRQEVRGRYAGELVLQQILDREPLHPGAHHYRIHNWDGPDGVQALDSSRQLPRITTKSGHTRHMPGHVLIGLGMWHEGAIAMDAANRVELAYQRDHRMMPFASWNYVHNRSYLSYIQEQLGMPAAAIRGAEDLLAAPSIEKSSRLRRDPREYGTWTLLRALVKFERWNEILGLDWLPAIDKPALKFSRKHAEALAHLGRGDQYAAEASAREHGEFADEVKDKAWLKEAHAIQALEIKALLALAKGETLDGLTTLGEAAMRELKRREMANDPPNAPRILYNLLGRAYLDNDSPGLAVKAFEHTLEFLRNQGTATAGLVEAHSALGNRDKAQQAYSKLLVVWSDADPDLPELVRAKAAAQKLGLADEPASNGDEKPRRFTKVSQEELGTGYWVPNPAPPTSLRDAEGSDIELVSHRGKNVILAFYPGKDCTACLTHLKELGKRKHEFDELETIVVAVTNGDASELTQALGESTAGLSLSIDSGFKTAKNFGVYDEFEQTPISATVLLDKQGKVYWARAGHEPLTNFDFLLGQIRYLNRTVQGPGGLLDR